MSKQPNAFSNSITSIEEVAVLRLGLHGEFYEL